MLANSLLARLGPRPACGLARAAWRLRAAPFITSAPLRAARPAHKLTSVTVRAAAASESTAAAAAAGFGELGLSLELLAALEEKAITVPTEIQVPGWAELEGSAWAHPVLATGAAYDQSASSRSRRHCWGTRCRAGSEVHPLLPCPQSASVPALLRDRRSDFLLASHTGSGKTLAYLLPIGWPAGAAAGMGGGGLWPQLLPTHQCSLSGPCKQLPICVC